MNKCEENILMYIESIKKQFSYIQKGENDRPWLKGRLHSSLSLDYLDLGMLYIAMDNIPCAKGAFFNSVRMRHWIFKNYFSLYDWTENEIEEMEEEYDKIVLISPSYLTAAAWKQLFLAVLANYPDLDDFARMYEIVAKRNWPMYEHVQESRYIGLLICCVLNNNQKIASQLLEKRRPRIDPMFRGIPECLEHLTRKDKGGFFDALMQAENQWQKIANKEEKEMPYSICFIYGTCLLKLSESIFGNRVIEEYFSSSNTKNIPVGFFNNAVSQQNPCPIPDSVLASVAVQQNMHNE